MYMSIVIIYTQSLIYINNNKIEFLYNAHITLGHCTCSFVHQLNPLKPVVINIPNDEIA